MASNVKIQQEVLDTFEAIKSQHTFRYFLMGFVNSDREIGVLKKADKDAGYDEFLADLKEAGDQGTGRYAIYDLEFELAESKQKRSRLVFVSWSPDTLPIRQKMLVASSKESLKKKLTGFYKELQANAVDDASEAAMLELCKSGDRGAN